MRRPLFKRITVLLLVLAISLVGTVSAAPAAGNGAAAHPVVRYATRSDSVGPLRDMPQIPPLPGVLREIFGKPIKNLPNRVGDSGPSASDPVLQGPVSGVGAPSTGASFDGVGNENGVLPPDPVGDIGPNHYVQMVNLSFAIYDRFGNLLEGPADNNTLWQGFGGACETTNSGDPIVLYDHLADRWMMSQFALPNGFRGPFYQCIAVSQTADPTGSWYRYEFLISNNKLNDYPKFGLWPDGYYMSINQFACNPARCNWAGAGVVAFERDQMLTGGQARMVYFDLESVNPDLGGMLPADLDGPPPPSGAPNPFAQIDDDAWGYSPDQIQFWNFHIDWNSPSSSTFASDRALTTASFDSNMCGYSRNCIPQPSGTKVDAISDRLMYRLQYRNFGGDQRMVVNHTVDTGGDHAGVRWYELQNEGSGWSIRQQGTWAPDTAHRWMGSAAMNGAGDIALGYSVSSTGVSPSIRFTGRLAGDTLGQMTQGEGTIVAGSGYQTHSSGRWGDYSMLAVDPTDDCTFWYTQEYYNGVSSASWRTRIGSFQLAACGPVDNPPTVSIVSPADGSTVSDTVPVQIDASDSEDAVGTLTVEWNIDGGGWQLAGYNTSSGYYEASWDSTSVADGSHTINARATDSATNIGNDSNNVTVDNVNDPPVASFTYNCSGLNCNFDASASDDPDGSITTYDWTFGDGGTGSGVTASHSYAAAGTYTVELTVTDNDNATGTSSQSVTVSEPAAGVTVGGIEPNSVAVGNSVDVTISGAGFVSGANVTFENGQGPAPSASNINVVDSSTITATVTAPNGGPPRNRVWDVRVTNPDGGTGVLAGGFTVTP